MAFSSYMRQASSESAKRAPRKEFVSTAEFFYVVPVLIRRFARVPLAQQC